MEFKEEFHPKIKSDLKKIDKTVANKIRTTHLNNILKNPYKYDLLKGDLKNLYSNHFVENRVDYRIVYEIINNIVIFYYMIGKRENFYKTTKRRI